VAPVPSLFTFNIPERSLHALMGVSVKQVRLRLQGRKDVYEGPLLITHWGLSGPAALRASAWEAEYLHQQHYKTNLHLDWTGLGESKARAVWAEMKQAHPKKKLANADPFGLPERLRQFLLERAGANGERILAELPKADENRLLEQYLNGIYAANGKTTYKEEFVTAGGVSADAVDPATMECRSIPGLYFAGEVLDVDGITGGFNFQAAWSTGYVAGINAAKK
jgi:predicted Rossmann fold flavoprotein